MTDSIDILAPLQQLHEFIIEYLSQNLIVLSIFMRVTLNFKLIKINYLLINAKVMQGQTLSI